MQRWILVVRYPPEQVLAIYNLRIPNITNTNSRPQFAGRTYLHKQHQHNDRTL
jgi:hypothetical protein